MQDYHITARRKS